MPARASVSTIQHIRHMSTTNMNTRVHARIEHKLAGVEQWLGGVDGLNVPFAVLRLGGRLDNDRAIDATMPWSYLVNTMVGVIAGLVAAAMRKGSPRRVFQDHDLDNNNNLPQQSSRSKH